MTETIKHGGRVESVSANVVNVRIVQSSACSACSAAHLCHSSESKEKLVSVITPMASSYVVGQQVTIMGSVRQSVSATWWAYVLPLLLAILAVAVAAYFHASDGLAALLALVMLVVYYFVLYMLRSHLERKFAFSII